MLPVPADPVPSAEAVLGAPAPDEDVQPDRTYRWMRSVSQLDTYGECGTKYYLSRVAKVPQRPAWWSVGGLAGHTVIEAYERVVHAGAVSLGPNPAGAVRVFFGEAFTEQIERTESETGVGRSEWQAANARREPEDEAWWRVKGADMVHDYVSGNTERDWRVLVMPDGEPCLEVEFRLDLGDGLIVRGYIDQAREWPNGHVGIVDYKFGSRIPVDPIQLKVYALGLSAIIGRPVLYGQYWAARKAELKTYVLDPERDLAEVRYRFATMDRAERAGLYLPRPSNFCGSCAVGRQCPVRGEGAWSDFPAGA